MQRGFQRGPAGSVLIETGGTKVVCAATVEERVPHFLRGTGEGWIAAEYALLPSATGTRTAREVGSAGLGTMGSGYREFSRRVRRAGRRIW